MPDTPTPELETLAMEYCPLAGEHVADEDGCSCATNLMLAEAAFALGEARTSERDAPLLQELHQAMLRYAEVHRVRRIDPDPGVVYIFGLISRLFLMRQMPAKPIAAAIRAADTEGA